MGNKNNIVKRYILAIDEGTTSCRASVYDTFEQAFTSSHSVALDISYPQSGWVEQDAEEIYSSQYICLKQVLESGKISLKEIYGLGITNQRESVVVWDRLTGKAIAPCINWQCRRTSDFCQTLIDKGLKDIIRFKTGLLIDAYFSASKIKWILDNVPFAREWAMRGELMAGTIDSWLIYRLTNGKLHITDYTNAARTMLFNINTLQWDEELLEIFDVPECILPKVVDSAGIAGSFLFERESINICGIAGDQQASLFGQACFDPCQAKSTYGTGCFILTNIGDKPVLAQSPLLTTIAWKFGLSVTYALEGSVFNAGSTIQWVRDELGLIKTSEESYDVATSIPDSGGVYLVPAFTGLGAPYWDMNARAAILGITRATGGAHIVRAALESIAYSCFEVYKLMEKEMHGHITEMRVDGGASGNRFLMQFQADLLDIPLFKARYKDSTILGATYLAGLGSGAFESLEQIKSFHKTSAQFMPTLDKSRVDKLVYGWRKAVNRTLNWVD